MAGNRGVNIFNSGSVPFSAESSQCAYSRAALLFPNGIEPAGVIDTCVYPTVPCQHGC